MNDLHKRLIIILSILLITGFQADVYAQPASSHSDGQQWWIPAEGFRQPQSGEHPRLLFRKSDLPDLRKKAGSPVGKAFIARLKYLLDGEEGIRLPVCYNSAKAAYTLGPNKNQVIDSAGVYTFGHVAGYGLLYQLTGEKKFAQLGRRCFEMALEGQRDRDDRYSWVDPGGALRAGPVIGWYAVGYDLCYDGWDEETRVKFGKAIEFYDSGIEKRDSKAHVTLETLVTGTMPPFSNHFGMQVGGTALALMAIRGEPWADQQRIDSLLQLSEKSMIRNATEGFGDGGFFAEGDGTGSMSSHIVYLASIQAWKNSMGMDFIHSGRTNILMMALKWFYLTVFKNGKPDMWPIRGGYPHNAWSGGLSGSGYIGYGMGVVPEKTKTTLKWMADHFFENEGLIRDAGPYPHAVATAFINWPEDLAARNPNTILPHCYTDNRYGFYAWRNRWHNENDVVISALTKPSKGYMGAVADTALAVSAFGTKFYWGNFAGEVESWSYSESGKTSTLTFKNGTSIGIDLTGKSGSEVLLVTTGEGKGRKMMLGNKTLTFKHITRGKEPELIPVKGGIRTGKQIVTLVNNEIHFKNNN